MRSGPETVFPGVLRDSAESSSVPGARVLDNLWRHSGQPGASDVLLIKDVVCAELRLCRTCVLQHRHDEPDGYRPNTYLQKNYRCSCTHRRCYTSLPCTQVGAQGYYMTSSHSYRRTAPPVTGQCKGVLSTAQHGVQLRRPLHRRRAALSPLQPAHETCPRPTLDPSQSRGCPFLLATRRHQATSPTSAACTRLRSGS